MLLPLSAIQDRLRCPRTGRPLEVAFDADGVPRSARVAGDPQPFAAIGGCLALIDPDSSVVDTGAMLRSGGQSAVPRHRRPWKRAIKRALFGDNAVAHEKCARILSMLKERPGGRRKPLILIIGGGSIGDGTAPFYEDPDVGVVSFDIYASPNVTFIADAHSIPLADGSVDAVWIQAVLEHVLDPVRVVAEIHRVLAPGGLIYADSPFMQHVHEGPYDFFRFSENAHRWLFRAFERLDSGAIAGPGTALIWALRGFFSGVFRSRWAGKLAALPFFWVRFFDRIIPPGHASDAAASTFFFGRAGGRPLTPREAVANYRGAQGAKSEEATRSRSDSPIT